MSYESKMKAWDKLSPHFNETIRSIYHWASPYLYTLCPEFEYPEWDYRTVKEFLWKYWSLEKRVQATLEDSAAFESSQRH